jgi:DNA-binding Xre family transcriptional regulator
MRIEYNNLRKLLIDKIMKKKDINNAESINSNTIAKFGRKEEDLFETFAK